MKIAIDIGHNCSNDGGAVGFGNENSMNLLVGNCLMNMLAKSGVEVIAVRPTSAVSVRDSLRQRVSKANSSNVDYYVSLHHNAGGGQGCEVFYVSNDGCNLATEIVKQLSALGFKNRGAKYSAKYFVLNQTKSPAVIVETCFVDTESDVQQWRRVGAERIAKAIHDGLNSVLKFA